MENGENLGDDQDFKAEPTSEALENTNTNPNETSKTPEEGALSAKQGNLDQVEAEKVKAEALARNWKIEFDKAQEKMERLQNKSNSLRKELLQPAMGRKEEANIKKRLYAVDETIQELRNKNKKVEISTQETSMPIAGDQVKSELEQQLGVEEIEETITDKDRLIEELRFQNQELTQKVTALENDKAELVKSTESTEPTDEKDKLINELKQENIDLRNQNKELTEGMEKLIADVASLGERIDRLENPTRTRMEEKLKDDPTLESADKRDQFNKWLKNYNTPEKQKALIAAKEGEERTAKREVKVLKFNPKEFFKVPTAKDFNPDEPFKRTKAGTDTLTQFLHKTYQIGYGERLIDAKKARDGKQLIGGEKARNLESTIEELQAEEKRVLMDYYGKLLSATEASGSMNESEKTEFIADKMAEAKRDLERHIVKSYGEKVNQERRSNWWLRFVNFLNSDIAEKKTLGYEKDILAMRGGNRGNATAAIKNIALVSETKNETTGKIEKVYDYKKLIPYMNAHVRRAIKKSLDTSITKLQDKQIGFYSPDDIKYDRYETYHILQKVYSDGMAKEIEAAMAQEELENGNETTSSDKILEEIMLIQKKRLTTLEEDIGNKLNDVKKKLKAVGIVALIGLLGLVGASHAINHSNADQIKKDNEEFNKFNRRTPKITKVVKVDETKTNNQAEDGIDNQNIQPSDESDSDDTTIIKTKINGRDVDLKVNKTKGRVTEEKKVTSNTAEELNDMHTRIADINTANLEKPATTPTSEIVPGGVNKPFITSLEQSRGDQLGSVRMSNLEGAIRAWNNMDQVARDNFNTLVMNEKVYPTYQKILTEAGFPNDFYGWAQYELKNIQDNLGIKDIE